MYIHQSECLHVYMNRLQSHGCNSIICNNLTDQVVIREIALNNSKPTI